MGSKVRRKGLKKSLSPYLQGILHILGFKKAYNLGLCVVFVGALMGFCILRFQYLDHDRLLLETSPIDAIHFEAGLKKIGIILHLAGIIPGAFLACFQFVPIIRHRIILFHRINGYLVILLFLMAQVGAYIVTPISAGGHPATQAGLGLLGTGVTIGITLAYYNVKRLQIDQHRAWMMRSWVWAASIISLRLIQLAGTEWITRYAKDSYYDVQTCSEIWKMYRLYGAPDEGNPTPSIYPQCDGPESSAPVLVSATADGPEGSSAILNLTFGVSLWTALVLHAAAIELYLQLTPAETERLKTFSYQRQVEAGFKNPGRSGLTADRIGDAVPYKPTVLPDDSSTTDALLGDMSHLRNGSIGYQRTYFELRDGEREGEQRPQSMIA